MQRISRRFLILAPFALVASAALAQDKLQTPAWLTRGLEATVETVSGDAVSGRRIRIETPADLGAPVAGHLFSVRYDPEGGPEFQQIHSITGREQTTEWFGSEAAEIESYCLGSPGKAVPPPPDWRRDFGTSQAWRKALPASPGRSLPYLRYAQYVWPPPQPEAKSEEGEYLLRQKIAIGSQRGILRATLRIAGSASIRSISLNDQPIHLGAREGFTLAEYEVTQQTRPGENLLAIWAWNVAGPRQESPCLAFHLEVKSIALNPGEEAGPGQAPSLVLGKAGEAIWGRVEEISEDRLSLESHWGSVKLPWDLTRALLFPQGWHADRELGAKGPAAWLEKITKRGRGGKRDPHGIGLPLQIHPGGIFDQLLLVDGQKSEAKPSRVQGDQIFITSRSGEESPLKLDRVAAIYPPESTDPPLLKPYAELSDLYCRASTSRGDTLHGILREVSGKSILIESQGGEFLKIPSGDLARLTFPYHGSRPMTIQPRPKVGLLQQSGGLEGHEEAFRMLTRDLQQAVFQAGMDTAFISQAMLVDGPEPAAYRFPIIASVDPLGEYLDTVKADGDVRKALDRYVSAGGTLLLYSRGGALRTAIVGVDGRFIRKPSDGGLADLLGLKTIHPGDASTGGLQPFDRPENLRLGLVFVRPESVPSELARLPRLIDLSLALSPPYYPMAGSPGSQSTLYQLRDASGKTYGPALSVVRKDRGRVIILDHLLWSARIDDQPFSKEALPDLLSWAARGANMN